MNKVRVHLRNETVPAVQQICREEVALWCFRLRLRLGLGVVNDFGVLPLRAAHQYHCNEHVDRYCLWSRCWSQAEGWEEFSSWLLEAELARVADWTGQRPKWPASLMHLTCHSACCAAYTWTGFRRIVLIKQFSLLYSRHDLEVFCAASYWSHAKGFRKKSCRVSLGWSVSHIFEPGLGSDAVTRKPAEWSYCTLPYVAIHPTLKVPHSLWVFQVSSRLLPRFYCIAFKDFNASQDYLVRSFCEIITIHCVGRGTCGLERVYSRAMSLSMPQHCKARQMPMAKDVLKELGVCLGYCCKAERQGVSKASDGITWHGFFSKVLKSADLFLPSKVVHKRLKPSNCLSPGTAWDHPASLCIS